MIRENHEFHEIHENDNSIVSLRVLNERRGNKLYPEALQAHGAEFHEQ